MLTSNDSVAISSLVDACVAGKISKEVLHQCVAVICDAAAKAAAPKPVAKPAPQPKMKKVRNLMSGKEIEIPSDTPLCCDPSSETYWSM